MRQFTMYSSNSSIKTAEEKKVPDELLQKLHQANQQFHQAKQVLEATMGDDQMDHQKRFDLAEEQLRVAEREVEKITMEIQGSLKPPAVEPKH
jgi:hypothetical protein